MGEVGFAVGPDVVGVAVGFLVGFAVGLAVGVGETVGETAVGLLGSPVSKKGQSRMNHREVDRMNHREVNCNWAGSEIEPETGRLRNPPWW